MNPTTLDRFKEAYFETLEETFEQTHGIYLDRGTSLMDTLNGISAEMASQPIGADCATLAAQVAHVCFYIEHLGQHLRGENPPRADWGDIWRTVGAVTPDEWEASKAQLRDAYQRIAAELKALDSWDGDEPFSGALAILIHTAYHLGEIRQALCFLRME